MSEVFLERLLPTLGFVVLQRTDRGDFRLVTPAPQWFADAAQTAAGDGLATLGGAGCRPASPASAISRRILCRKSFRPDIARRERG